MAGPLRLLAVLAVVAATLAGGYLALVSFRQEKELSVGSIRLSVSPGHKGALDLYVPLVDWGARFEAIRLPARLRVDLRTVDRGALEKVAQGAPLDVGAVRAEARDAIAGFLRALIAVVCLAGLALGVLTAFAVRHHHSPRLRWTIAASAATDGRDRRRARRPAPAARRDRQAAVLRLRRRHPARARRRGHRPALRARAGAGARRAARRPRPAGHPAREPAADRGPAADHDRLRPAQQRARAARSSSARRPAARSSSPATSPTAARRWRTSCWRGSRGPASRSSSSRATTTPTRPRSGSPATARSCSPSAGGSSATAAYGPVVNEVAGLRVAGYGDPYQRLAADDFADRFQPEPTPEQVQAFSRWFERDRGRRRRRARPPAGADRGHARLAARVAARPAAALRRRPHPHAPTCSTRASSPWSTAARSARAARATWPTRPTRLGLARLSYDTTGGFEPLAVDLVEIDPGDGNATARRERLDQPEAGEEPENSSATS